MFSGKFLEICRYLNVLIGSNQSYKKVFFLLLKSMEMKCIKNF